MPWYRWGSIAYRPSHSDSLSVSQVSLISDGLHLAPAFTLARFEVARGGVVRVDFARVEFDILIVCGLSRIVSVS